ncbi:MAG: (Fe-S)-binding protein [Candidatus Syntrophoarchaeum sp. GoM_oil]|nr:MAG: (Fe-S)-binding protein [Candidatus Syntrophoarchaeum sp. GoM_oil]
MIDDVKREIDSCDSCKKCIDICPTYLVSEEELFAPLMRLKSAKRIFEGEEVSERIVESMYNCPECARCDEVCPKDIKISEIIAIARMELVKRGFAPLETHKKIINGIMEKGNSVNGDPDERLDWLPEPFEDNDSDTLLYPGCLPSYLVKNAAKSSYLLLKAAGVDFRILENEGCCGVYLYDAGVIDQAREIFSENTQRFKELGIKRIITPCAGCYRCFKRYYPELIEEADFEVLHVVEVLHELLKKGKLRFKIGEDCKTVTYHDPCRLGRKEGLYDEPRELLAASAHTIDELEENRAMGMCCGAGAGIRSIYRNLSMEVASILLDAASETLVTSCPFCAFNMSYASTKKGKDVDVRYITEVLYEMCDLS